MYCIKVFYKSYAHGCTIEKWHNPTTTELRKHHPQEHTALDQQHVTQLHTKRLPEVLGVDSCARCDLIAHEVVQALIDADIADTHARSCRHAARYFTSEKVVERYLRKVVKILSNVQPNLSRYNTHKQAVQQ